MKVAIVGSRSFDDYFTLKSFVTSHIKVDHMQAIVSGGAKGADKFAEKFAYEFQIPELRIFVPQWLKYGKRAGYLRNKKIVSNADVVIAFWDGESKGTKSTINLAIKMNKIVHVHTFGTLNSIKEA